ncbi:MAG: hypothetical protein LIP11_08970, partial [Clostridiales bacterium]|nr:hypothetical protein [Clostridiales bacterium]
LPAFMSRFQKPKKNIYTHNQNRYQKNATMELLGHQVLKPAFSEELKDVIAAYPKDDFWDINTVYRLAVDVMLLGRIYGIREERARRKAARV